MKKVTHRIEILETLRKVVDVVLPDGSTDEEARHKAMDQYQNGDIILSADNYYDTEFNHLGVE